MLVQVSMFPTGRKSDSVSAEVAKVIDIIDRSGLPYRVTAMATIIEGEWAPIMAVVNKARLLLRKSHGRVYISMTIDDRRGAKGRLTGKVESLERKLGRKVRS
jgi:uncharacterized protein (TIGR00106 family)